MTNPYRGELCVDLAGTPTRLRLTFAAIVALEQKTGTSLLELARTIADGKIGVGIMAEILAAASNQPVEVIGAALVEDGLVAHLETCLRLLEMALEGMPQKEVVGPV